MERNFNIFSQMHNYETNGDKYLEFINSTNWLFSNDEMNSLNTSNDKVNKDNISFTHVIKQNKENNFLPFITNTNKQLPSSIPHFISSRVNNFEF